MASQLKFYQLDVFTTEPFSGNPLAVFPWASGITTEQMQSIAREMNLSETTFVTEPKNKEHDFHVRIFTPGKEIPFGGHPTLGTAEALKLTGQIEASATTVTFNMGVGPVTVDWENGRAFMTQPAARFNSPLPADIPAAQALGLNPDNIHPDLPVQEVSTGFPALLVPLKSLELLQKIQLNLEVLKNVLGELDLIYPFGIASGSPEPQIHARSFAPFIGIPEDPATGSVAGALGAYLMEHGVFGSGSLSAQIKQGVEMGRPSELHVEVSRQNGTIDSIRVGGNSCVVLEGELLL